MVARTGLDPANWNCDEEATEKEGHGHHMSIMYSAQGTVLGMMLLRCRDFM